METIDATYPMELVHMDCLTIEANEGGKDVHILVIMDHFMSYAQAIVTSPQTAKCTTQNLWDKFCYVWQCYTCVRLKGCLGVRCCL